MIVVDASALVEVLVRSAIGKVIESRLFAPKQTVHAPHLLIIEVAQVIRRYVAKQDLDFERGSAAFADLANFRVRCYPHQLFLGRVWDLRHNLTAYDASYVALAEILDSPLITRDRRLAAAAGHRAQVELV